jgi:sulfur carrier protein ThiS
MTITVEFDERLTATLGAHSTYIRVEGETTVAELLDRLTQEFGREQLGPVVDRAEPTVVRRSAVASQPLAAGAGVFPGDRIRISA